MLRRFFGFGVTFKQFIEAAEKNNLRDVQSYINAHPDVAAINAVGQFGNTALTAAAYQGHTAIVTALLAKDNIALNAANHDGYTALSMAAYQGHTAIVTALLAKDGIAINAANRFGNTALSMAAYQGHTTIVIALLAKIVDVNHLTMQNNASSTAIQMAELHRHSEIADLIKARILELGGVLNHVEEAKVAEEKALPPQFVAVPFSQRLQAINVDKIPKKHCCPISHELMDDPITVSSGQTFDRKSLTTWFAAKGNPDEIKCPLSNALIKKAELNFATNILVKSTIEAFVTKKEKAAKDAQLAVESMNAPQPLSPVKDAAAKKEAMRFARLKLFSALPAQAAVINPAAQQQSQASSSVSQAPASH